MTIAEIIKNNEKVIENYKKYHDNPYSYVICFQQGDDCTPDTDCPLAHLCGEGHNEDEQEAFAKEIITSGQYRLY